MAYWKWGDATAPHLVVCAHGLARQGRDFDELGAAMVERAGGRVRVVCPDVAGRGRSDWLEDAAAYQLPTYVADMLAMLAQLAAEAPIETLDWVGTSMGGLIGMAVAGTPKLPMPASVRRLVLNDVGPVVEWKSIERIQGYIGKVGHFDSVQQGADALWEISKGFGTHTPEQWMALSRPMLRQLPDGAFAFHYDPKIGEAVRAVTQEAADQGTAALWQLYDAITSRVLVTRGAESGLLSKDTAFAMTQRGPRASLVELPRVGRAPMFVQPIQLEAVLLFLLD